MTNKQNQTAVLVVSILLSLGVGFYGGTKYQSKRKPVFVNQFNQRNRNQTGQNGQSLLNDSQIGQPRGGINRPVAGEIISSDGKSLTVKMNDGSSKIIFLSSTTQINKAQAAVISDLKVGEPVSVFGQTNPDGSVTAQNIQLNPQARTATPSALPSK